MFNYQYCYCNSWDKYWPKVQSYMKPDHLKISAIIKSSNSCFRFILCNCEQIWKMSIHKPGSTYCLTLRCNQSACFLKRASKMDVTSNNRFLINQLLTLYIFLADLFSPLSETDFKQLKGYLTFLKGSLPIWGSL